MTTVMLTTVTTGKTITTGLMVKTTQRSEFPNEQDAMQYAI